MSTPNQNSRSSRAALGLSCAAAAFTIAATVAHAGSVLYVATSTYAGTASTVTVGQPLPNTNGATAIADGSYPGVFANDTVDGNFGITSPIELTALATRSTPNGLRVSGLLKYVDLTALTGASTSFSSKSELQIQPSADGTALTLMGYAAAPNLLDISNTNTPDNVDPSNSDTQTATYRAVIQVNLADGLPSSATATSVDAYSGNNGRGAVLAPNVDGSGSSEYLLVGNAGNGSGTEPTDIVNDTGVQTIAPNSSTPMTTVIGAQQGVPGSKDGFDYGFSVASLGDPADKSGKDDNFRGLTVFNNTLYVSKGSGSNGVDTVYQVTPSGGGLPTAATGPATQITILPGLPTGLAANISENNPSTEFYPFGIWFANATTLYIADEGSQDLNADPNAGLEKWIYNGTQWVLAYTIQAGLNLDQPYSVPNYPSQDNPATTGLRQLTGSVNGNQVTLFATTATFSNLGDPGADPNALVRVVDQLDATTLPANEAFSLAGHPTAGRVYRGVALVATN
jgi:hypothetical protein